MLRDRSARRRGGPGEAIRPAAAVSSVAKPHGSGMRLALLEARRVSWAERLREVAADPMLGFLALAALVYLGLGERVEAAVLLLAALPLIGMDAFLHRRARASTAALESQLGASATAVRDGRRPCRWRRRR